MPSPKEMTMMHEKMMGMMEELKGMCSMLEPYIEKEASEEGMAMEDDAMMEDGAGDEMMGKPNGKAAIILALKKKMQNEDS